MIDTSSTYAVILAGGSGERFWPLSTPQRPKQFLPIVGDRSMLQQTVDRLAGIVPSERVIVITAREYAGLVREQLPYLPSENVILEPCGRDTAAAVGLGALQVARRCPQAVMLVLPADHYIARPERFRRILRLAVEKAFDGEQIVTLGIVPHRPETGYGYICCNQLLGQVEGIEIYRAVRFTEKPVLETARKYLAEGGYFWNSGMFIWRVDLINRLIDMHLPELSALLRWADDVWRSGGAAAEQEFLAEHYHRLPKISVDYGIMEKTDNILLLAGDFGWDDIGSWTALERLGECDECGNVVTGQAVLLDTYNCLVQAEGGLVAALGVRDLIIVQHNGALLICPKVRAQEIKKLVQRLPGRG
ncbi:MAG: mannose-1-phosphate guanylyltransferase [Bacillota bacterium]